MSDDTFGRNLISIFDQFRIISLPERVDRRKETEKALKKIGLSISNSKISFFDAIRPKTAEGFDSVGAHGAFQSHLAVFKEAHRDRISRVLIAEDDLEFQILGQASTVFLERLSDEDWDIFYAGYHYPDRFLSDGLGLIDVAGRYTIGGAHMYSVSQNNYEPLIEYLEAVLAAPPPRPHVDMAISDFRKTLPHCVTLVASPAIGIQRRSRSDIQDLKFYDRLKIMRPATDFLRSIIGQRRS